MVAERVVDEEGRRRVVEVLRETYDREKGWVNDAETQAPTGGSHPDPTSPGSSPACGGRPAGALRVFLRSAAGSNTPNTSFKMLDPNLDVEDFIRRHRVAGDRPLRGRSRALPFTLHARGGADERQRRKRRCRAATPTS